MNPNAEGKWFRSESYTYALGGTQPVKLDFLAPARHMTAPEVADIIFEFTGTVGGVTGGALGRDAAKLFDTVYFSDEEEVINASGAMLRVQEQHEFGSKQVDPGDVASGSTNSAYRYLMRVTFEPIKAQRARDTRVPVDHFLEGGIMSFTTPAAVPTGWAAVQSDQRVRVHMRVVDGRTRELKSRMTYREVIVSNQEYDYEINGSIRSALLASKLTTTGYSSMAGYTTIFSRTMELPPAYQTALLVDRYRRFSDHLATNDEFTLATPGAIPLISANREQKIGEMINTKTLHVDHLAATATNERLLVCAIKDRTPNLAALVAGFASVDDLRVAMAQAGVVVADNGPSPVSQWPATLVRRLPVRIKRAH